MEAEDRQALRRERKRQKDKKVRRIVWIVLAVLLAAIVILKLCEVDFGSLRGGSGTSSVLTGNFLMRWTAPMALRFISRARNWRCSPAAP